MTNLLWSIFFDAKQNHNDENVSKIICFWYQNSLKYFSKISLKSKQINDKPFVVDSFDAKQYQNEKKSCLNNIKMSKIIMMKGFWFLFLSL